MTKLILAAPSAPARKNDEPASLLGYVLGSAAFVAAVVGMFSLAGFSI